MAHPLSDFDYEYVVEDPVLGRVSCNDADHASRYAYSVDGEVYLLVWHGGKVVDEQLITC